MSSTRTRVIGTCRLVEPLGKGGMAEVYRGLQGPLQREVAVKVMLPEFSKDAEAVTRFRREALALAGLSHENILAIHDLVEKNDQLFMVMELVDGVDVKSLLDEGGALSLDVALIVAAGVAAALEHAHFRKVLHRDVKPGNVMLSRQGDVKLADFGIAKDMTIDDLTKTGLMVGTPSYMAPEILKGQRPDPRTDLYAVGVMLFEMLTGRKPFTASNHGELFANIASGKRPKLRSLQPDVPRAVDRIVERCLALEPKHRWTRTAELRDALDRELSRHVVGTPSARIVYFLKERGRVREDDMSYLDLEDRWFGGEEDSAAEGRLEKSLALSIAIDESDLTPDRETATAATPPPPLPTGGKGEKPEAGSSLARMRLRLATAAKRFALVVVLLALLLAAVTALGLSFAPEQTEALLSRVAGAYDGVQAP
jgi:eukaryotic-like serine/threonine-protein kinase